jgi:putative nucleotidyltransferase with HDIG domain
MKIETTFLRSKLGKRIFFPLRLVRASYNKEDLLQARRLSNQMAVALSNAQLIKELDELNWGILLTLARVIDAKSPWTAGHSERVTKTALRIGQAVGLDRKELEVLQRGGLLHDIGKLGVPPEILDKADKLSLEEEGIMRGHVGMGVRIIEPIVGDAEVIPIVSQHHEYFDGTGYPSGLTGENISLGARIFAMADCFDAMTSDRPYRKALSREFALKVIKEAAGTQFDPEIVQTFLMTMDEQRKEEEA